MKKMLILGVFIAVLCVSAMPAMADVWSVDKPTALGLHEWTMVAGYNTYDDGSVADNSLYGISIYDGPSAGARVYGSYNGSTYVASDGAMDGQVGFMANIGEDVAPGLGGNPIMQIFDSTPGLTGNDYTGISLFISNDNDDDWLYQLYYKTAGGEVNSGAFAHLASGYTALLTTAFVADLDLVNITEIGFRVKGHDLGIHSGSNPDTFHTSVVPVPGAVLLALLGFGATGLKLRRFA